MYYNVTWIAQKQELQKERDIFYERENHSDIEISRNVCDTYSNVLFNGIIPNECLENYIVESANIKYNCI